jgi:hypothetical protein
MRRFFFVFILVIVFCGVIIQVGARAQEIKKDDCFFLNSLHYSARGMSYWYSRDRGGLEILTGIPYDNLGCKNCHTAGCDVCHKSERTEKECKLYDYSIDAATNQNMCLKCHGREKAMIGINHKNKQEDLHLKAGMKCNECHTAREMHGDGTYYVSLKQPGAMVVKCETCHDDVTPSESHTAHGKKLDCKACHIRHVVSCTNCHFETMVEKGVRKAIPVSGWMFLINYNGQVTSGSMQTFVTKGDKTFLMFAPHMSHSVMEEGRKCDECHETETMKKALKGQLDLLWFENGKVCNLKGVVPVTDEVDYICVYQNYKDDKWIPIANPPKPVRQYAAFGKPLTREQLEKLSKKQKVPPPKMDEK